MIGKFSFTPIEECPDSWNINGVNDEGKTIVIGKLTKVTDLTKWNRRDGVDGVVVVGPKDFRRYPIPDTIYGITNSPIGDNWMMDKEFNTAGLTKRVVACLHSGDKAHVSGRLWRGFYFINYKRRIDYYDGRDRLLCTTGPRPKSGEFMYYSLNSYTKLCMLIKTYGCFPEKY